MRKGDAVEIVRADGKQLVVKEGGTAVEFEGNDGLSLGGFTVRVCEHVERPANVQREERVYGACAAREHEEAIDGAPASRVIGGHDLPRHRSAGFCGTADVQAHGGPPGGVAVGEGIIAGGWTPMGLNVSGSAK